MSTLLLMLRIFLLAVLALGYGTALPPCNKTVFANSNANTNSSVPPTESVVVFEAGVDDYPHIRIPSILALTNGTILAFAEGRQGGDHAKNDIILKRSMDGGKTWGAVQVIDDHGGDSLNDPLPVEVRSGPHTGRIYLFYMSFPEGCHTNCVAMGYGPKSSHNWLTYSDDSGATWSPPEDVTAIVRREQSNYAGSPGVGIQLRNGPHSGRLVIPLRQGPIEGMNIYTLHSDDGGDTWTRGDLIDNGTGGGCGDETSITELPDGSILLNARAHNGAPTFRKTSRSIDGGQSWSPLKNDEGLITPHCMASILSVEEPHTGRNLVLYAGPGTTKGRSNGSLFISGDGGKTWPHRKTVVPTSFAYSQLVELPEDPQGTLKVGLIYEGEKYGKIVFMTFPLEDPFLTEKPCSSVLQDADPDLTFEKDIQPILQTYCLRCHGPKEMKSGIRLDEFGGKLNDEHFFLLEDMLHQISNEDMPPAEELQPSAEQRRILETWIRQMISTAGGQGSEHNGTIRRLTVSQYRNTLKDLLGIEEDLTGILPPDAISRDGFTNNSQAMTLSPLLLETYFEIAEQAIDRCIIDENEPPVIQNFRVDLGRDVNPEPYPKKLILGAGSNLLANQDIRVLELSPKKSFDYTPFAMQTKYRFIEGYRGNDTVRGWRDFDSIYHAVFADMRGTGGYPKGLPHQTVPGSLLLRPAIPSKEIFGQSSTYGPQANFKIAVRELPDHGRFRITVRASKYNDALLLGNNSPPREQSPEGTVVVENPTAPQTIVFDRDGIYQADVYLALPSPPSATPKDSNLHEGLIGRWPLNGDGQTDPAHETLIGRLDGEATFVESPFGKALQLDGDGDALIVERDDAMNVEDGEFTVTAWIHPRDLKQGGIVCLGKYNMTHGWYLDMPNNKGVLRIETVNSMGMPNGTVTSTPGVLRKNAWQHVAAVVRHGENQTRLYVNGYEVASGTVESWNLDNPEVAMHIGRIQDSKGFKGEIDEVRIYRRALEEAEILALLSEGSEFIQPPPKPKPELLHLNIGDREFASKLNSPAFMAVRIPEGPLEISAKLAGPSLPERIVFTPLEMTDPVAESFYAFEQRNPKLSAHLGFRRDCGSTLPMVQTPQSVSSNEPDAFVFEGSLRDHPTPDVEKNNVNYLAGIKEIGIRSAYTDGRDMPRLAIHSVEFEGPLHDSWPPKHHRDIFIESDSKDNPSKYAREIIRSFATRAFRRPVSTAEEEAIYSVWERTYQATNDSKQAIRDALLVILTSPQFLFLIEDSPTPNAEPLEPYELASKLSYFLWNTAPDSRLLKLAETGELYALLDKEIDRLIHDPRFKQFVTQFTSEWLSLDKFDTVEINSKRYPKLTRDTKTELRKEPIEFMTYLIQNNLPVRHLIQSDFILANEPVAAYYGMPYATESGFEFVPIKHEDKNLGGILTQASILAGLSDGQEANPVKRGAWFARKIIAEPPSPPPPNVPELKEDTSHLPLRERLFMHRNQPGCVKCHEGIDPWGIPFEQFDAGGLFIHEANVDARSTLPDGTEIEDLNALKEYLATVRLERTAFSLLKHLATYAAGRDLSYAELEYLEEECQALKINDFRMQDMMHFVINSKIFLTK